MDKFGKWITGGLGWALFGPIGGIVGFVVGSLFDKSQQLQVGSGNQQRYQTTQGGYVMSLLVLVAAVMKADSKILKSELDYLGNDIQKVAHEKFQKVNEAWETIKKQRGIV